MNRPHVMRARESAPNASAVNRLDRADVLGGARPFRGRDHAWNVEFTHLLINDRYGSETPVSKGSQSPATCSEDLETQEVPTQFAIWEDLRVTRTSTYIQNFLVELLDEAGAHSHEDNIAMANAIIEIGLSDKTHHEQTEDLQEWVNTYAWAATDETTSKQEDETEESELDDDSKADS